jgi:hypothetical protein
VSKTEALRVSRKTPRSFDRRRFLQGLSAATLVVPALLRSEAASARVPGSVVIFYVGGGLHDDSWWQRGRSSGGIAEKPLTGALAAFDADFASIRPKLTIVEGAHALWQKWPDGSDLHAHAESTECALTCTNPEDGVETVSLDRRFAEHLASVQAVPYPALQFCATRDWVYNGRGETSRNGSAALSTLFENPLKAYERVFAGVVSGGNTSLGPTTEQLIERGILSSSLEQCRVVLEEVRRQMGEQAAQRVQQQCDGLRDMEKRLAELPPAPGCTVPAAPGGEHGPAATLHQTLEVYRQLGTNALACGLTNVVLMEVWRDQPDEEAAFQAAEFQDLIIHLWHFHRNNGDGDQDLAYRARIDLDRRTVSEYGKWAMDLDRFQLLDSGLLVWSTNEPRGDHSVNGQNPCIYAGSLGGKLRSGQYIRLAESMDYGRTTVAPSINEVYVSMLRASGLETDRHGPDKHHRTGSLVSDALLS